MRICSVQLGSLADYLKTVSTNLFVSPLFVSLFITMGYAESTKSLFVKWKINLGTIIV